MEVCTIIAKNYVAHARVLARSLAEHNPESRLWTLIIDDFTRYIDAESEPFEVLTPADIGCESFTSMALRYTVLELSTAVKPWLLRHLMEVTGGPITYLDPDIKVYGRLNRLDELAVEHGIVLIPHNNAPLPPDGLKPSQIDVMIAGVYNLGYVSLAPSLEVDNLLDWWADRLRRDCRVDPIWGYFVDQRWFDLVPGFLTDFALVREPEYNVAYWNLHSRRLEHDGERYLVDGEPLAFFHFSGFDPERPRVLSRHQNRIDVTADPVLERLLAEYAGDVMNEGHAVSRRWPYSYLALGDGTEIDELVRSFCEQYADEHEEAGEPVPSPFTLRGARRFEEWLAADAPGAPEGVNRVLARVYRDRDDLQEAYPDLGGPDRKGLLAWVTEFGAREVPLLAKLADRAEGNGRVDSPPVTHPSVHRPVTRRLAPLPDGPWGFNVVGPFGSEGELGRAAGAVLAACDEAEIPAVPLEDPTSLLSQEDRPFSVVAPAEAAFAVNLVCVDPAALPQFAGYAGERFFAGRYSIGLWFCAPPLPAQELAEAASLVQEVWTPSAYCTAALTPFASVPVKTVPVAVRPTTPRPLARAELGLPGDGFVFLFALDLAEGFERQNPLAVLETFDRAFAPGDAAQLVISCANSHLDPGGAERLHRAAAGNRAVQLVDGAANGPGRADLLGVSDCYVSLHRAEAFGLSMAEAMWLGKPVIATGYSGNLEFMTPENSRLVDFELVAIDDAARHIDDAGWAEPDLDHAAQLMRRAFADPAGARALGARAAADIRRRHAPRTVAEVIERELDSIRGGRQGPPALPPVRQRHAALARAEALVTAGPVRTPRAGRGRRIRGLLRSGVLRLLKPYAAYQERVNSALLDAVEETGNTIDGRIQELQADALTKRAQLMAEVRRSRGASG